MRSRGTLLRHIEPLGSHKLDSLGLGASVPQTQQITAAMPENEAPGGIAAGVNRDIDPRQTESGTAPRWFAGGLARDIFRMS